MKTLCKILVIILIIVLMVGCGSKPKDGGDISIGKDKVGIKDESGKLEIGEGVDLPKGYPKDIVPLYEPESILVSWEGEEGEYGINYTSKGTLKEATDFYKAILEDASEKYVMVSDEGAAFSGTKCGIVIAVGMDYDKSNEKTNIIINIAKDETPDTGSTDNYEVIVGVGAELPDSYPEELVPLCELVTISSTAESDDTVVISYLSTATKKEAYEFYKEVMAAAEDKFMGDYGESAQISGYIDEKFIAIHVTENSESESAKSTIYIEIQN